MEKPICSESDCEIAAAARGFCKRHYGIAYRAGSLPPNGWHRLSDIDVQARLATCSVCGPVKIRSRGSGKGYECMTSRRKWRKSVTPETRRREALQAKYGIGAIAEITSDESTCPICLRVDLEMHVDHDHLCCPGKTTCGRCIRGYICRDCNLGLGRFSDSPERLLMAIAYLASPPRVA